MTRDETDNVHLLACPWYHTAPLVMSAPSMHLGPHRWSSWTASTPSRRCELIERYRVTITHLVPTQFVRLLALPEEVRSGATTSSSLRHVIHGAAPCSPEVKRRMIEWLGPVIDEYYASTEGVGGTIIFSDEWLRKPGSVGKARNDNDDRDHGRRRRASCRRGRSAPCTRDRARIPFEYFKDPEKTAKSRRGEVPHRRRRRLSRRGRLPVS